MQFRNAYARATVYNTTKSKEEISFANEYTNIYICMHM